MFNVTGRAYCQRHLSPAGFELLAALGLQLFNGCNCYLLCTMRVGSETDCQPTNGLKSDGSADKVQTKTSSTYV
jgi:hypothetical protein